MIAFRYQIAARIWLTAALFALFLPESWRLGIWLPLHLTLAGAATVAISGAMQAFVPALTATDTPPKAATEAQFLLVNAGAALIAVGVPAGLPAAVALGGTSFVCSILILVYITRRAWSKAINRRHRLPIAMYVAAMACVLAGGTIGALLGSGAIKSGGTWAALRHAHMTLNVLGWVSLVIAGTLITLLPTTLRVRMPSWRGSGASALLASGVALMATGFAFGVHGLAALGGVAFALGALGLAWMVRLAVVVPRRWPVSLAAKHLMAAVVWFVAGAAGEAVVLIGGPSRFDAFRSQFIVVFVLGWIVQILLGAWSYLLPGWRGGSPEERRAALEAMEFAGTAELVAMNAGVALAAVGGPAFRLGAVLALGAGAFSLAKAWLFPWMAGLPYFRRRALERWGH